MLKYLLGLITGILIGIVIERALYSYTLEKHHTKASIHELQNGGFVIGRDPFTDDDKFRNLNWVIVDCSSITKGVKDGTSSNNS